MTLRKLKIGRVLIKETKPQKWMACWLNPATRKYERHVLPYNRLSEVKLEAERINVDVLSKAGFTSSMSRFNVSGGHSIREAVLEAVTHSDARPQSKRDYLYRFNPFTKFLAEAFPKIERWSEVNEKLLTEYMTYCRKQKLAHDTVRQRFAVLKLTSSHMARNYPELYRHVTHGLRMKRNDRPKVIADGSSILRPDQLRPFLGWLKNHDPRIHLWAMLQGLCGLRMQEAIYLRTEDINFTNNTITIAESAAHTPKNRQSFRTIPVCDAVMAELREWRGNLQSNHPDGYLFFPRKTVYEMRIAKDPASQCGCYGTSYVSNLYTTSIREARKQNLDLPEQFIARKLRASFITAMRSMGADYADLQTYVGQSVGTVLSDHYDFAGMDRMEKIAALAGKLLADTETVAA